GQFAGGEVPSVAAWAPVNAAFDLRLAAVVGPRSAELGQGLRFGGVPTFGGAHRGAPVVGHHVTPSSAEMRLRNSVVGTRPDGYPCVKICDAAASASSARSRAARRAAPNRVRSPAMFAMQSQLPA